MRGRVEWKRLEERQDSGLIALLCLGPCPVIRSFVQVIARVTVPGGDNASDLPWLGGWWPAGLLTADDVAAVDRTPPLIGGPAASHGGSLAQRRQRSGGGNDGGAGGDGGGARCY